MRPQVHDIIGPGGGANYDKDSANLFSGVLAIELIT